MKVLSTILLTGIIGISSAFAVDTNNSLELKLKQEIAAMKFPMKIDNNVTMTSIDLDFTEQVYDQNFTINKNIDTSKFTKELRDKLSKQQKEMTISMFCKNDVVEQFKDYPNFKFVFNYYANNKVSEKTYLNSFDISIKECKDII